MRISQDINELIDTLRRVEKDLSGNIETLAKKIQQAFAAGNKVILMGNGGSASDAQHIAAEFVGRYKKNRRGLPALALNTNTSTLTAVGNDFSYDDVFSRQIEAFARPGDIIIGISTSGNSANVLKAVELARKMGCYTVGLLGRDGGKLRAAVDLPLVVACNNTPRVQECHIAIGHIVCEIAEENY